MQQRNFKITFYKEAKEDLVKIKNYIINNYDSVYIANIINDKIINSIINIPPFPNSYQLFDNEYLVQMNVRKKTCGKYIIAFRTIGLEIEIIGIFSSRRLFRNVFEDISHRINNRL